MSSLIEGNPWVWVVIQDPGGNEQFLGQHDEEQDISFIPIFLTNEEAMQCYRHLPQKKEKIYEVQAIQYEELVSEASKNGFLFFVLNGAGEVLDKIKP